MSRNNMWFATSQKDTQPKEHSWPLPLSTVEKDHMKKRIRKKLLSSVFCPSRQPQDQPQSVVSGYHFGEFVLLKSLKRRLGQWLSRRYEKVRVRSTVLCVYSSCPLLAFLVFMQCVSVWTSCVFYIFGYPSPPKKSSCFIMAAMTVAMDFFLPRQSHSRLGTLAPVAVAPAPPHTRSHPVCRNGLVLGLVAASRRWSKRTHAVGFGVQEAWRMADGLLLLGIFRWIFVGNTNQKIRK